MGIADKFVKRNISKVRALACLKSAEEGLDLDEEDCDHFEYERREVRIDFHHLDPMLKRWYGIYQMWGTAVQMGK